MPEESPDERHARQLGSTPQQIRGVREQFYASPDGAIMLHVLFDRIEQAVAENQRKLETIAPENLQKTQGEIFGLRRAINLLKKTT